MTNVKPLLNPDVAGFAHAHACLDSSSGGPGVKTAEALPTLSCRSLTVEGLFSRFSAGSSPRSSDVCRVPSPGSAPGVCSDLPLGPLSNPQGPARLQPTAGRTKVTRWSSGLCAAGADDDDDGVVWSTVSGSLVRDRKAARLLCAREVRRGELLREERRNHPRAELSVLVSPRQVFS